MLRRPRPTAATFPPAVHAINSATMRERPRRRQRSKSDSVTRSMAPRRNSIVINVITFGRECPSADNSLLRLPSITMRRPEHQVVQLATRASELLAAMIFRPAPDVTRDRSGAFDEQEKTSRKEVTMPERYESSDFEKMRGLSQEGGGLMRFMHHQAKSPFALRKFPIDLSKIPQGSASAACRRTRTGLNVRVLPQRFRHDHCARGNWIKELRSIRSQ